MSLKPTAKTVIGLSIFWVVIIFYIGMASVPFNPLSIPKIKNIDIALLIPEGWGFFTKNPKESTIVFFTKNTRSQWITFTKSNSDKEFLYGLSRKNRRILAESSNILKSINDTCWLKRESEVLNFSTLQTLLVKNSFKKPIIKGDFIVVKQERLPWAWSRNYLSINMPYEIIRIQVF